MNGIWIFLIKILDTSQRRWPKDHSPTRKSRTTGLQSSWTTDETSDQDRKPLAFQKHYSVVELSKLWGFSQKTLRRLFVDEPGIIKIAHEETRQKRGYTSVRIPEYVAKRVHRRLQGIE